MWFRLNETMQDYALLPPLGLNYMQLGCFTKTWIEEKKWLNPFCNYLGVGLKESKMIFDFDKY